MNRSIDDITNAKPQSSSTRDKPPRRLAAAVGLASALTFGPLVGPTTVLLPLRFGTIDPGNKVLLVSAVAVGMAIFSLVSNLIFGVLSDRTRSRFGRRAPWMIFGSVIAAAGLLAVGQAPTVPLIIASWTVFQLGINALIAGLTAVIPDRVPPRYQGTFSSVFGVGQLAGATLSVAVAGQFVTAPAAGFAVFATMVLLAGPLVAVMAPDRSNRHEPRERIGGLSLLRRFSFPVQDSRDFYLALFGKLLFVTAAFSISGFLLYILTDFVGASLEGAGDLITVTSLIGLVTGLIFGVLAGPLSDRLGRRKVFVIGAAVLIAIAILILLITRSVPGVIIYAIVGGIGTAVFGSVDQALNYNVLPAGDQIAKNLGVLNIANTGGQILGPAAAGAAISFGLGYAGMLTLMMVAILIAGAFFIPIKKVK